MAKRPTLQTPKVGRRKAALSVVPEAAAAEAPPKAKTRAPKAVKAAAPPVQAEPPAPKIDTFNLTAKLPIGFKVGIRSLLALPQNAHKSRQDLITEALNDLFLKYREPTVD